jgi:hypothetical protein
VLPIPGPAEAGIGFKTIGEAIHLRNHVLGRLDAAAGSRARSSLSMSWSTRVRTSRPRCASSPPGRLSRRHSRVRNRKKLTTMLTTGEQQELRHIEQELRDADRGFTRRLTVLQGMLRWAAPDRQVYLLVLAVLAAALLRLAAAAGRMLMACAEGAVLMEPMALMALGGTAWLGRESGPAPGTSVGPAQDGPPADGTDLS